MRVGAFGFHTAHAFDEIHRVLVVLIHPGGDGQNIEVKNNVLRREIQFLREQLVCPLRDGHLVFHRCGLSFFVKGHHHHRRAVTLAQGGLVQELLFAAFEADGVDDALALQAFQSRLQHAPLGTVHHNWHARNIRIRSQQIQEAMHARLGIEQAFVKADVDDVRAVLHLLPRERECALKVVLLDEFLELRRAHHVGAFADLCELARRIAYGLWFESAEAQRSLAGLRHARFALGQHLHNGLQVRRCGAATTACHIQQSLLRQIVQCFRGINGPFVITRFRQGIGQACIWITMHKRIGFLRKLADVRRHLLRAERAIDAHGEGLCVGDGIPKRLGRLAGKRATGGIGDRHRNHHRQPFAGLIKNLLNGKQRRLEIERIKGGFRQQNIHATFNEPFCLLAIRCHQIIKRHRAIRRVIHIRRKRRRAIGWPDCARYVAAPRSVLGHHRLHRLARELGTGHV